MLKISISDSRTQRRLILEGRLIVPWLAELRKSCASVKAELHGRELVIDIENVTVISVSFPAKLPPRFSHDESVTAFLY